MTIPRFSKYSPQSHVDLQTAFESHVEKTPTCWIWTGTVFSIRGGYGAFTCRPYGIFRQRAHRIAWKIYCGEITSDQHVLHRCDNPICVNPEHLFIGDQPLNMTDKVGKNRQNKGENHGRHKLTELEAIAIRNDPREYTIIAAEYGISVPTVSDIKCARSWKHLGPPVGRYNL